MDNRILAEFSDGKSVSTLLLAIIASRDHAKLFRRFASVARLRLLQLVDSFQAEWITEFRASVQWIRSQADGIHWHSQASRNPILNVDASCEIFRMHSQWSTI